MLSALVRLALRFRGTVVALACLLTGYGLFVAARAPLDVFPDFVQPQVAIQTEAPGLTPEQVESLVTLPVELALNGVAGLESLRSESIQGLSVITVVFHDGTDVRLARQSLAEKLGELAGRLPAGVKPPRMTPLTSSTMDLLKVGLVSGKLGPMELRAFADWTLKPRLLAVPGVAKCSVFGGDVRQWQIQVHPDRLVAHDLALADVLAAARASTAVAGAGFIENANQRILLQTEGQSLTAEALGATVVVQRDGGPVRLRDVATVTAGVEPKYGDTLIQGGPGVLLTLSSQYGANTLDTTRAVEAALADLAPLLEREGITLLPRLHRPATFIETALANIRSSLVLGAALVAAVLLLFLGRLRIAFISLTAIPLSLLTAVILLEQFGVSLNTITLGGLAIAIGEVVDDAIIDVENIFRRLRENAALATPRPALDVVLSASLEVRSAVVYATFVVALVFVPVLTLTGLQGKFFGPLALSYLLAVLASLAVALTVTPALALLLFRPKRGPQSEREPWLQRLLQPAYAAVLTRTNRVPALLALGVLALGAAAVTRLAGPTGALLPDFREGHFVLQVNAAPGTSLPEMLRQGRLIAAALRAHPHVATVEQQIGRAELGEDPWGPHRSEFHVELRPLPPGAEEHVADEIRAILAGFPGIQSEVLTFLGDRIGETLAGETAPVVVNVFGDDLDDLDEQARRIARVLREEAGAVDVQVKSPPGLPRQVIRLRPDRLAELGFRPAEVLETLQAAWQGAVVAQTYEGARVTDVAVILEDAFRREPETLGGLLLRNTSGARVPLREVADLEPGSGRHSILHTGARRRQTVTCGPGSQALGQFVARARELVAAKVTLPPGVYLEFTGAAQAAEQARRELLLHSALAAAGIVLLLSLVTRHWRNLLLVLANLPFALVGGVAAVEFTAAAGSGGGLTMGALVGFVTLFGITTRNSIMLVSHYEHLVGVEGQPWNESTAIRGASERLAPILMTALVTGLGLLPLAVGAGAPGREIEGPMAVVILGGLVTSTVLNLVVLPGLALAWGRFGANPATACGR